MWFEQILFDKKLAISFGQLAADTEFIFGESGGYFLNGTLGWPSIAASDLPCGGPVYPFATPGVLVTVNPNDQARAHGRPSITAIPRRNCAERRSPGLQQGRS